MKKISFMRKNCEVAFFEPPFGGLTGNLRASSILYVVVLWA